MATINGGFASQDQYKTEQYAASSAPADASTTPDVSKDEIGWYFVEQYYNTLSKSPEKLHLFYNKRSQFLLGPEAEVLSVSVGRSDIQERIKQLHFHDCKVRISNVDSQASDDNILIQVIGETANSDADLKKFVQTFVLAQQPSGYFVLNSIFRYIKEDDAEETAVTTEEAADSSGTIQGDEEIVETPKAAIEEEKPAVVEEALPVEVIDQKLEEAIESVAEPTVDEEPATNGEAFPETKTESTDEAVEVPAQIEEAPSSESATNDVEAEIEKPEVPQDPVPTPTESKPVAAPAPAAKAPVPSAPAKPMSWANRAAAAAASAPKPAVPQLKPAAAPVSQPRAPATSSPAAAPVPQQAAPSVPATANGNKENDEPKSEGWQSVGDNTKRQNRPQAAAQQPQEKEGTMGYLRNVVESVNADELKAALTKHGEVTYFDINRSKNCAFVEFKESAGYQNAFKANPLKVGGEDVYIEARRPKSAAFGGNQFNNGRGGMGGRGRGNFPSNGQRGRGDFGGANRGRGGAARGGRGGATQPATAS